MTFIYQTFLMQRHVITIQSMLVTSVFSDNLICFRWINMINCYLFLSVLKCKINFWIIIITQASIFFLEISKRPKTWNVLNIDYSNFSLSVLLKICQNWQHPTNILGIPHCNDGIYVDFLWHFILFRWLRGKLIYLEYIIIIQLEHFHWNYYKFQLLNIF